MNIKSVLKNNKKKISDFALNIGAMLIMNCVLQFLCYPVFEKTLGKELNGQVLTMLSVVSITAGSVGSATSYSRLIQENVKHPSNSDYNVLLLIGSLLCGIIGILYMWSVNLLTPLSAVLFALLLFFTTLRYYCDVEYKINTNFLKYFFYYLLLSIGYVIGIFIFKANSNWIIAILLGEILAVVFAMFSTKLFKAKLKPTSQFKFITKSVLLLVLSTIFENLTLNADRLILNTIVGGTAVTQYYVASLFGKVIALLTVPVNSIIISYLIRFNGKLSKKTWLIFVVSSIVVGAICLIGCIVGSIIILPYLYDWFNDVRSILVPAILSQVFFFLSGILLVVLLRFYGEKKQFTLNLIYSLIFFIACIICTILYGLNGFVYSSLAVNALRMLIVVLFGFFATGKKNNSETNSIENIDFSKNIDSENVNNVGEEKPIDTQQ